MTTSTQHSRLTRRRHAPWWVVSAWASLLLVALGGLAAASGLG